MNTRECPFCGDDKEVTTVRGWNRYANHLEAHARNGDNSSGNRLADQKPGENRSVYDFGPDNNATEFTVQANPRSEGKAELRNANDLSRVMVDYKTKTGPDHLNVIFRIVGGQVVRRVTARSTVGKTIFRTGGEDIAVIVKNSSSTTASATITLSGKWFSA